MTRSVCVLAAAWCLCGTAAFGQSAGLSLLAEGNQLYRDGDFEAARRRYLQVVEFEAMDSRLYYNLGNACLKTERLGEAIVWYERALRLSPRDEDVQANLRFARHLKRDREPASGDPAVWRFLMRLYLYPTLNELSVAFSLCWIGAFCVAGHRLWRPSAGGPARTAALALCVLLAVSSAGFLASRIHSQESRAVAIVTAEEATAHSGPDAVMTIVFILHEGTEVRVDRREGQWVLVRLANGLGGWLAASAITEV